MSFDGGRNGDVQSVQRALHLLEVIAQAGEIGVSELAREVDLAVSTVHSLVRTLARRHYLMGAGGRYRLGPAVTVLMSQWDAAGTLASSVLPMLNHLTEETGHAATATVLVGREACLFGFVPAPGPVTVSAPHFAWADPLRLATGRVLVALSNESEWAWYLSNTSAAEPGWSSRRWTNELRQVQRTGVSVKTTKGPRGISALAVPVWTRGAVVCAIGCSAPTFLVRDLLNQKTLDALWTGASTLSSDLGCEEIPLPRPRASPTPTRGVDVAN